jgi:ribosomal protein S14
MQYQKQIKDIHNRGLYINKELVQRIAKIFFFSFNTNLLSFTLLNSIFLSAQDSCFKTHVKNFCVISGRSRAIHKKFKVSRILLLELGSKGYFFGLKKASW